MSEPRLASGFWIAAKMRQVQNTGGYASVLVKGHDEAGAINLILRNRAALLKWASPAFASGASPERQFVWKNDEFDDATLQFHIERELRFDRDQWFVEFECDEELFLKTFNIVSA